MRSPSGSRPHARRVRGFVQHFPFVTIAACAVLFIAVGCSKGGGGGEESTSSATPSATAAAAGMPFYNVSVSNFTYHGAPSTVPANKPFVISFTNKESFEIVHEFVVVKIPAGKTAQDVINDTKKKGPKGEDDWIHMGDSGDVPTGATSTFTLDLPPGNYLAACWQTGKAGGGTGPPHITIGMVKPFTAQ